MNEFSFRFEPGAFDETPAPVAPAPKPAPVPTVRVVNPGEGFAGGFARTEQGGDRITHAQGPGRYTTAQDALTAFGLDWRVTLAPLQTRDGFQPGLSGLMVPDHYAVVREDTQAVLGVVGDRYAPLQNTVALGFLDALTDEAPIVRGGAFKGGRRVYLQTDLGSFSSPSGEVNAYGLAHTSHDGSGCASWSVGGQVVVCQNTCDMALARSQNQVKVRHTSGVADRLELAQELLATSRAHCKELQELFMAMGRRTVNTDQVEAFLKVLWPEKAGERSKRAQNQVDTWRQGYEAAPGAKPGTAWGLFQASTYYADHMRAIREGTDAQEATWFGAGAQLRDKAAQQVVRLVSLAA